MLIDRPNHEELTDEDRESLDRLKSILNSVIADGKVSREDIEIINCAIYTNGKVLVEEITLVRQLVRDQLESGLLTYEY